MQQFLNKLDPDQSVKKIEMLRNNKTSLTLTKNPKSRNCIKHIDMIYYHIQKLVDDGELEIKWIQFLSILANKLIKAL